MCWTSAAWTLRMAACRTSPLVRAQRPHWSGQYGSLSCYADDPVSYFVHYRSSSKGEIILTHRTVTVCVQALRMFTGCSGSELSSE